MSEKNEGSFICEVTADFNALYDASSDDAVISRVVGDVASALRELSERSADYGANEASAADTLNAVTAVRNSLYATKEYLYSVKADADCYVTGEVRHHAALYAAAYGLSIMEIGHYTGEHIFIPRFAAMLQAEADRRNIAIKFTAAESETNPAL